MLKYFWNTLENLDRGLKGLDPVHLKELSVQDTFV